MHIFTGTGVDLGEESYDQPGNPANAPRDVSFSVPASGLVGNGMRCCFINSAVGPYQGYWLFSDTTGEYIHCVLKVSSRQYRHFSIGRLRQLDGGPDLDPTSFYISGHFWASLDPESLGLVGTPGTNEEHNPYDGDHRIPWRGNFYQNGSFGLTVINTIPGFRAYIPGYDGHAYDWYQAGKGASLTGTEGNATKSVGTINTSVTLGLMQSNYYDQGLGAILFNCDRNFSANSNPLIPIYIGVNRTFAGLTRSGPVAVVPDVYRVNMRDFAPEETISIQGVDYKVFPVMNDDANNVVAGEGYSAWEGLAYRVETGAVP